MVCPHCGEGPLLVYHRILPRYPALDSHQPMCTSCEVSHIICEACQSCWYGMDGENPSAALKRIQKEELHS